MKTTVSVPWADIGSMGGRIPPSQRLVETVRRQVAKEANGRALDSHVGHTPVATA